MTRSVFMLLAFAAAPAVKARLYQPETQQLAVGGAYGGVAANPEIDAWHSAEQKKLEAECQDMMRKLWADKRVKLANIVDAARKKVDEERARLEALMAKVQDEVKELEKAKAVVAKPPHIDIQPTLDAIAATEAKIRELDRLIAEKKACIEELKQAKADLEEAMRKLEEARNKVKASEAAAKVARAEFDSQNGDIPPAREDLESAQEDLARATALRNSIARELEKARGDLSEHNAEVAGASDLYLAAEPVTPAASPVAYSAAPVAAAPPAVAASAPPASPAVAPAPKSNARGMAFSGLVTAVVASFCL